MVLCAIVSITKQRARRLGQARTCPAVWAPSAGTSMDLHDPPGPLTGPR